MSIVFSDLHIDSDFKKLLRPLTEDEFDRLESNIVESKGFIRDPLILWKNDNKYYVIDGHNRYNIMKKNNYTEFDYVIIDDLETKDDVYLWIIDNQLAKRNLTDKEKAMLIGMDYNVNKEQQGGDKKSKDHFDPLVNTSTAKAIAEKHNISEGTVKRNAQFVDSLNEIAKTDGGEEFKNKILTEEIKTSKTDIVDLAKESKDYQKNIINKIESKQARNIKEAKEQFSKELNTSRKTDELNNTSKYIWFKDDNQNELILKSKFQDIANKFIQNSFQIIFVDIPKDKYQEFKNEISKTKNILKESGFLIVKCHPEYIGNIINQVSKMKSFEYYYTYIQKREKTIYIENRRTESEYDQWIVFQKIPHKAIHTNIKDTVNISDFIEKFTNQTSVILDITGNIKDNNHTLKKACEVFKKRYIQCKEV